MRGMFVVVAVLVAACAPTIDGPAEQQRAADVADASRLARQITGLPGAAHADVTLHRPVIDPFTGSMSPASAAILVIADDRADRDALTRGATALVRGTAPEIPAPAIVVEVGAVRPQLASLGPFTVEARSRGRIVALLATLFAALAAVAGWVAWRERWRVSSKRLSAG